MHHQPRPPGPQIPTLFPPPSPWHDSQDRVLCWFLLNLHSSWASSMDLELSFRISPSGWALGSMKRIPGLCLSNCPLSPAFHLPIAPVFLGLPRRNQAQMWSEWQLALPYQLLAKSCTLGQPTLSAEPAWQNLYCARRRGWSWHEICGWASIQVQGLSLLLLPDLNSGCPLHPHTLKYVMCELPFFSQKQVFVFCFCF